ncbi:MAG: hypothetical protein EA411_09630 [Saprospirales bacterium]|nr:MAG: hypothetical protein EA411_09630 [Saprospirales bacterium]
MLQKFFLLTLLLSFLACANQKSQNYPEDVKLYHQLINKASSHIVCYEFQMAMQKYKEAFQYMREPFAIDIYNKMHVAIFIEDYDTMLECAKRLVSEKGMTLAPFEEATGYRDLRMQESYWEQFREWYPEGRESFLTTSNQEDIQFFRQMLEDDQKFRRHPERYTTFLKQNDSIDQVNAKLLRDYIQTNGYPTENRIGVFETSFRAGGVGKRVFRDFLNVVFRHYFGNFRKFDFDLSDILLEAVHHGHLHPELYKQYMMQIMQIKPENENLIPGRAHEASVVHLINGKPYITTIDEELIGLSDSLRAELYLSDSRTLFSKAAFTALNQDLPFNLFYANSVSIFEIPDPEQKEFNNKVLRLKLLENGEEYYDCD